MIFGLSKAVIASLILILSYAVLFSEKLNRAVAVMLGAAAMVLLGLLWASPKAASRSSSWEGGR